MKSNDRQRYLRPAGGIVAAAALVAALTLSPAASLAKGFLSIFEPTQVAPLDLTPQDMQSLRSLPNLSAFGTMSNYTRPQYTQVSSAAAAASQSGLPVPVPASLPAGVPSSATYEVATQGTGSFTFSAAKAQAYAASSGKTIPAMAHIDGSVLQATAGPAVVAVYGGSLEGPSLPSSSSHSQAASGGPKGGSLEVRRLRVGARHLRAGTVPNLIIAEAVVPHVTSTGASVDEIEDYLLSLPGVSPQLAAEIKSIGDAGSTLPIPIPITRANAARVSVQGTSGLAIGDNTGVGSGVIWVQGGKVYAVAGPMSEAQVLSIANALHT